MLPYAIITKLSSSRFENFDLDEEAIRKGKIPSEQEFTDAVKERYNEIRKPFKGESMEEFYDSEAWKDFQRDVRALYKEIGSLAVGEAPAKAIDTRLEEIATQMSVIKGLIKARKDLLGNLQKNKEEAAKVVQEAVEDTKMPVEKWETKGKKPSAPLTRKKQSPYKWASAPAGDPGKGGVHAPKEMSEDTKKLQEELQNVLTDLKAGTDSPTFAKSYSLAVNAIQRSIEKLTDQLNTLNREGVSLINRKKEPGKKTITVKTPPKLEPLSDVGDIPVWHEFMGKPETKTETKEVDTKHRNMWLRKPQVVESLLKEIHKEPEVDQHTQREDIGEDFLTNAQNMMQGLWNIRREIYRKFLRQEEGKDTGNDTLGVLKNIDPSTHTLLSIPEDVFNSYKNFLSTLSSKISKKDYSDLMALTGTGDYVHDLKDLPEHLRPYREKLQAFRDEIRGLIKDNTEDFDKKWGQLVSLFSTLRKNFADVRNMYNKLRRDRYFKTWVSGKPGTPFKTAGVVRHKDTGAMFKKVLEELHGFRDFVMDSPVMKSKTFEDFRDALRGDADELNDFVTGLGKNIEDVYKALTGYKENLHSYLENIIEGRVVDLSKLYPEKEGESEKKAYVCISQAFRTAGQEMLARDKVLAPYVAVYHLRRKAERWLLAASKVEKNPSEYEIGLPLQFLRTGPEGGPIKGPGGFSFYEFFQHSFPIEEFLNEWLERSGGTKLDASKLRGLINDMDKYVTRMVKKQYSKDALHDELKKAEQALEKNRKEIQQRATQNAELVGKAHNVMDKVNESLKNQRSFSREALKELAESINELEDMKADFARQLNKTSADDPPAGYTKEEWEKAVEKREKSSPARRPSTPTQTKKVEPGKPEDKEVEKKAPAPVKKMIKVPEKMHALFNHILDVASEAKSIVNPMTGKKEDYQTFKEKISRLWSGIEEKVIKNTNMISELQKKDFILQRKRNELEDWVQHGVDPDFIEESKDQFVPYLWNVIDEDWMGRGKVREFQTRFPAGLIEYFQIKNELEKLVGHRLNSRVVNRVRESLKQQVRWLKDRGMNADNAKEFLKQIGKDNRILDDYYKNPQESAKEIIELSGVKVPSTKEPELEPAKTALWDFPTRMSYSIASKFAGMVLEDVDEQELITQ